MVNLNGKLLAVLLAMATLVTSAALAAEPDWQEVDNKPEGAIDVDAANIRIRDSKLTAWIRVTFPHDMDIKGMKVRSTISLHVFECDAERSGVHSMSALSGPRGEGKIVGTEEGLPVSLVKLSYERPGTTGYKILEFVCDSDKRPSAAGAELTLSRTAEAEHSGRPHADYPKVQAIRVAGTPAKITRPVNPDDYYPPSSIRRQEQGSPVVQACVGPSGKLLREPVVTDTSGFPDLDAAGIKAAKATRYSAGTGNGIDLPESCVKFKVKFALKGR